MKIQRVTRALFRPMAEILAVALAVFWAASSPLSGADVRMYKPSARQIEISGGSVPNAWTLRYTTQPFSSRRGRRELALLVPAGSDRAWFSHGTWLRLLDTRKGLVIGRWRFPAAIVHMVPLGNQLQVEVEDEGSREQIFRETLLFDPAAPKVPQWHGNNFWLYRLSEHEPEAYAAARAPKVAPDVARRIIPRLEEGVRRDPLSPWFRIALAKLYRDVGDPRAGALLAEALRLPTTDYIELFRISGFLDDIGERESARAAFERAYRDFLERGKDPRLFVVLFGKFVLYNPNLKWDQLPADYRRELIERNYRLTPYMEGAEFAWPLYADYLEKNGPPEEARMWRARANEVRRGAGHLLGGTLNADRAILTIMSAVLAGLFFIYVLYRRYRPQRRFDVAARKRPLGFARGFHFFGLEYWSRRERIAFFSIALVGWVATGIIGGYMSGIMRVAAAPVSFGMGSFAGPVNTWYLEHRMPETPERLLLLGLAYQQGGDTQKAEALYRRVPQFAESWNNLGVLLKSSGREAEAGQAFERALQLDPNLAEAVLNLGRPPQSFWTELHAKYLPGRPMLAPPKGDSMVSAYLGRSHAALLLDSLLGPFVGVGSVYRFLREWQSTGAAQVMVFLLVVGFAAAVALLLLVPSREVTQPPGRFHIAWETLFPGTSPLWRFFGGFVLLAWTYFVAQDFLLFSKGSPYIITSISVPNLTSHFGIPADPRLGTIGTIREVINPNWVWVYVAPTLLFLVNFALLWRARRREVS